MLLFGGASDSPVCRNIHRPSTSHDQIRDPWMTRDLHPWSEQVHTLLHACIILQACDEAGGACWLHMGESCAIFCDSVHSTDIISALSHTTTGVYLCSATNRAGRRPQSMRLGGKGRHEALEFSLTCLTQDRVMTCSFSCMWLL